MPIILLERIPLPSLRAYAAFSVVLLASALFYAHQQIVESPERVETDESATQPPSHTTPAPNVPVEDADAIPYHNATMPYDSYFFNMIHVMTDEAWCVWTLVNTAYCCLILIGKMIQKLVFGELRVSEQQHLKDKFWNLLFYKFIFVFGVMNVQTMEEVVLWVSWFSVLGFFHLLTQLSKDRFEYLSFSPTTPRLVHIKLVSLLFMILASCGGLMLVCGLVGFHMGITIFAFTAAECLLLAIRTFHVAVRYGLHLVDVNLEGVWENRSIYVYYTDLVFDLAALSVDFAHHLHMLLWGNIFLSMASLVIFMQLRYLFHEFLAKFRRHKNYRRVVRNMEARFTMATPENLNKNNDDCAVCWERMETARKLPCGHLFHNSCLRSWLEQDTSCPTCRMSLNDRPTEVDPNGNIPDVRGDAEVNAPMPNPVPNQRTNHFFHFDGSRYVSWFPSFSVEVTHTHLLPRNQQPPLQTSQLDNMARQVLQVFQHIPINTVMDDLRITRSVDFTIENILEGRLLAPPAGTLITRPTGDEDETTEEASNYQMPPSSSGSEVSWPEGDEMGSSVGAGADVGAGIDAGAGAPSSSNSSIPSSDRRDSTPSQYGSRFSKSTSERENMLEHRMNLMFEQARRRYLSRTNQASLSSPTASDSMESFSLSNTSPAFPEISNNLRDRRELAYQAAARRLDQALPDSS